MTALQVIIKEAKAIRSKSPKMEWKKAVAQASAIYASKHKGKSPVGKKKAVKKAAKKKAVGKYVKTVKKGKITDVIYKRKKVGSVKKYTKLQLLKLANNAAYATGGDLDKMEYRLLDNHKLIPVYEKAVKDFEIKHNLKLSGVKKSATKKAKKKISEQSILNKIHKVKQGVEKLDEAQHKHMTGIGASSYALYNNVSDHIDKAKKHIIMAENHIFRLKQFGTSPTAKKSINMWKEYIKEQKTHISQLKKHI